MYRYGVVLADLGMETMIGKLMKDFILPMSTIFFPEVGGDTIDYYHGFIVDYGADTAHHLQVTLNVCLGEKFYGGELFLRGIRCVKHLNVDSELEEIFDYSQVPGRAVLHRGLHRHGALSTTSGHRVNMLLWCKSSIFREMSKEEQNSPSWCGVLIEFYYSHPVVQDFAEEVSDKKLKDMGVLAETDYFKLQVINKSDDEHTWFYAGIGPGLLDSTLHCSVAEKVP
ncbi:Fe2OG dioxygenase domain-containing protein [Heracleum sosnowskyi]|uniref:Fe2OG dioxygenase domain-containing protein n=1 Tax=Heracleum sosnowskyi TaxID=360622 RepID=A0AAD8IJT0_9APIA|nr:Fe2OG dioxygenase domain-containing protein [Heracleum sosnowskyi]KAK1387071.1 Fe2OG dioxygenase domain-containing protein [Heracleum sosnowskyi]